MIVNPIDYNQPSIIEHLSNFQSFTFVNRNTIILCKLISFCWIISLEYFLHVKFLSQKMWTVFQLLLNIARIASHKLWTILSDTGPHMHIIFSLSYLQLFFSVYCGLINNQLNIFKVCSLINFETRMISKEWTYPLPPKICSYPS